MMDEIVQNGTAYLLQQCKQITVEGQVCLEKASEREYFHNDLIQLSWEPIGAVDEKLRDNLLDTLLKRVLLDVLTDTEEDRDEEKTLLLCATTLDFCFHSKRFRQNPSAWAISYFDLFSTVTDLLDWSTTLLQFWPYAESRIEWLKMNGSTDPIPKGSSNLISYKQPLYDKLRLWNERLQIVQNNSNLNSPNHYIMKYKFEKFLSELLTLYEESNFNRLATESSFQTELNDWGPLNRPKRASRSTSEEIFNQDYNYVLENLIARPLYFAFKSMSFKKDVEKSLHPLLDAVLDIEEEFYKQIKIEKKKTTNLNARINFRYPIELDDTITKTPQYIAKSTQMTKERSDFWHMVVSNINASSNTLRPTAFEISLSNASSLYQQFTQLENDLHRKQFILQISFALNGILTTLANDNVRNMYKTALQKENRPELANVEKLDNENERDTKIMCEKILQKRIVSFYQYRDRDFLRAINHLLKSDKYFFEAKADGFKNFQKFEIPLTTVEPPVFDYSFKKYGFMKLGNKGISNMWNIETGLDKLNQTPPDPESLFTRLRQEWEDKKGSSPEVEEAAGNDTIVKQWQTLRSLRSQYLFEFSKVHERTGLDGFFDPTLSEDYETVSMESKAYLLKELNKPHIEKLKKARHHLQQKEETKKRVLAEGVAEEDDSKRSKVDTSVQEGVSEDRTAQDISTDGNRDAVPPVEAETDAKEELREDKQDI